MSCADDRAAEIEAQLHAARQGSVYGKTYSPAYEVAGQIKLIRAILPDKEEEGKMDSELIYVERKIILQTAGILDVAPTRIATSKR